ncbi:peptidoglycan-binding protein [Hyphomicrobium sp. ghe19]|uniref:peptidoglycan-binding protein n=1 Tax=Hyphomicrobium sp. ghe19 TaxID=2682968 RepID=UPI0013674319|nr:hypothetical protein HYPP_03755 [Hyphomicrobium sp. ghe19]
MTNLITRNDLARMYPRAPAAWLDAFVKLCPALMQFYKVDRLRWVHMNGQVAAEADGLALNPMRENMNFDAKRMLEVYAYRLNLFVKQKPPTKIDGRIFSSAAALAAYIQHKPKIIADVVYGGREGTPWMQGHLYIGRGPIQITHLDGYKAIGAEIARQPGGAVYDLVANPEILETDPEVGVRSTFAKFQIDGLWHWCDRDDCYTLSDALNTGNIHDNVKPHGLPRRQSETARAKAIWPADAWGVIRGNATDAEPVATAPAAQPAAVTPSYPVLSFGSQGPDVERLQRRLSELGFPVGRIESPFIFGKLTKSALVAFQAEHELFIDGIAGPRTWDVLEQAGKRDLGDRQALTAADLAASGSKTIAVTRRAKRWLLGFKGFGLFELFDQIFNIGFLDGLISQGERFASLFKRGKALAEDVVPDAVAAAPTAGMHGVIMVFLMVSIVLAAIAYRWFSKIEKTRVKDAQEGNNVAR